MPSRKLYTDALGDFIINYFNLEEDRFNYRKVQRDHLELELITTLTEQTIRHKAEIHSAINKFYKNRKRGPYLVYVQEQLNQVRFDVPCNIYTVTKKKINRPW